MELFPITVSNETGNGVVSQEEFAQRLERLRALDENADGEVSRDEFRSGMRARHHAG